MDRCGGDGGVRVAGAFAWALLAGVLVGWCGGGGGDDGPHVAGAVAFAGLACELVGYGGGGDGGPRVAGLAGDYGPAWVPWTC